MSEFEKDRHEPVRWLLAELKRREEEAYDRYNNGGSEHLRSRASAFGLAYAIVRQAFPDVEGPL